jgi:hypothetical protein
MVIHSWQGKLSALTVARTSVHTSYGDYLPATIGRVLHDTLTRAPHRLRAGSREKRVLPIISSGCDILDDASPTFSESLHHRQFLQQHAPARNLPCHSQEPAFHSSHSFAGNGAFFRPLRNIRHKTGISFTTVLEEFRYPLVASTFVTTSDFSVLAPGQKVIVTLVARHPFSFVGPAPSPLMGRAVRSPDQSIETESRVNQ